MARIDLYDFSDLLFHAESLGYDWNTAHHFLDYIYPYHGVRNVTEEDLEELQEDGKKVLKSFMESEELEEFSISPKGG